MIRGWPWARLVFGVAVAATAGSVAWTFAGGDVPWALLGGIVALLLAAIGGGVFVLGSGLFARPILAVTPARAAGRVVLRVQRQHLVAASSESARHRQADALGSAGDERAPHGPACIYG